MVPGNLPSQLEILSTGQTYYETLLTWALADMALDFYGHCQLCFNLPFPKSPSAAENLVGLPV